MSRSQSPEALRALAEQHDGRTGTQAELARAAGWDKSHVTRLKQLGQLVVTDAGAIDFAASLRRIAEHADPARDAQREAAARRRTAADTPAPPLSGEDPGPRPQEPADARPVAGPTYADARATKEHWQAQTARVEYERLVGSLVPRADVERAIADAAMLFRQAVDNQPHRLSDRLVGRDHDGIRALLRDDGQAMLAELSRAFARRLADAAAPEGAPTAADEA